MTNNNLPMQLIKPSECQSKEEVRNQIDKIDSALMELFAERFKYVREIVKHKEKTENAIVSQERKDAVIKQRGEWAQKLGLDKKTYADIFQILIDHNISRELEILEKEKNL